MIFREYFVILLLAHIIGDFYFQTEVMAYKKGSSLKWVLVHGFFYWMAVVAASLPVLSGSVIIYGTGAAVIHVVIDLIKYYYIQTCKKHGNMTVHLERRIFYADQILHLFSMFIIAFVFTLNVGALHLASSVTKIAEITNISPWALIPWITVILAMHKPANIAISKMLAVYRPEDKDSGRKRVNNAGRSIGTIERMIMLVFISLGQYSAMGLVLTAKSIARYDKIVKEPEFAEYYLLGTLLSTLAVIVAFSII